MLSLISWLPSSLSDSLLEVIATADQTKRTVSLSQHVDFSVLNAAGDIWDNVSAQLNKMYNKGLVIFLGNYMQNSYILDL